MRLVEGAVAADRQTDTMQRQRIVLADGGQITVRRAAPAHVIFGMDFEESKFGLGGQNSAVMFGLEAKATSCRNVVANGHHKKWGAIHRLRPQDSGWALDGLKRAGAERGFGGGAGALGHKFPGIALIVHGRSASARRAFARRAVILALK